MAGAFVFKADFHSVQFSDWTGNPSLTCENVALDFFSIFLNIHVYIKVKTYKQQSLR